MKSALLFIVIRVFSPQALADVVLTEKILNLTRDSARLSSLAYSLNPEAVDFQELEVFIDEPDQALIASKDGYCYAAFRGTTLTALDWSQNLQFGKEEVCNGEGEERHCCMTRSGFFDAFENADYKDDMVQALRRCSGTCVNKDECVVLTGHSQGGAVAAVAAVALVDLNPYVITFGQPPTLDAPCSLVTSERWYRYVNSKDAETLTFGIVYDPVPFAPGLGADNFGHMILLSGDPSGVAYIGLDSQDFFGPLNINGFQAHGMIADEGSNFPGYLDRITSIMQFYKEEWTYPVRTTGYLPISLCTEDIECETGKCGKETGYSWKRCVGSECSSDDECETTGRCDSGICVPKLGSCQACDEGSDCMSGHCTWHFVCTNMDGLLDNECECNADSDCQSGRCEGLSPRICEARLSEGAWCNENTDCTSNKCWSFRCRGNFLVTNVPESETTEITSKAHDIETTNRGNRKQYTPSIWIRLLILALVLSAAIFWGAKWTFCRRHGYQQIPTTLNA